MMVTVSMMLTVKVMVGMMIVMMIKIVMVMIMIMSTMHQVPWYCGDVGDYGGDHDHVDDGDSDDHDHVDNAPGPRALSH